MSEGATHVYPYWAAAFGYRWASDFPLRNYVSVPADGHVPDVRVNLRTDPAPPRDGEDPGSRFQQDARGLRCRVAGFGVLDTYDQDCIDVRVDTRAEPVAHPELPAPFYGSVTASLLARRGGIPMHASAVAVNGKALLICGHSGAGKSTLTAALIASGANFISDDLSVLQPRRGGVPPVLFSGRRSLRLFPAVAALLQQMSPVEFPSQHAEKLEVVPLSVRPLIPVPLFAVLILGAACLQTQAAAGEELGGHIYRAGGLRGVPGHTPRLLQLRALASRVPVYNMPPVEARDSRAFRDAAQKTLDLF